jgi:FkbM family methyltransferase
MSVPKSFSRIARQARRALGLDRMGDRLEVIERQLAQLSTARWPHDPIYLGDHTALVAARWGAKLLVDTRDTLLTPWLLLDGLWETTVTGWLQRTLQPGQVFVDVGANIGYFTLLAGTLVGSGGQVVAIEAHPLLADLLRRNVVMNGMHGYITTWHRAAWDETTNLAFHLRERYSANSSVGSLGTEQLSYLYDEESVVEVEAARLDDLLDSIPRVDVIKVDVEGAELRAFHGLERTLRDNPAVIVMFEWSPAQIELVGDAPADLVDFLAGLGFTFRLIEDDLAPIERARLVDLAYGNVVASRSGSLSPA